MGTLDRTALAAIIAYQCHLSPRKGFCCAYRARYGDLSCSEYARQTLILQGLWQTLPLLRQRLHACRDAAQHLDDEKERRKRRRDTALDCLPDACPDTCDSSCIPDACSFSRV